MSGCDKAVLLDIEIPQCSRPLPELHASVPAAGGFLAASESNMEGVMKLLP